ncbi:conserved hypothetical protein [Beutenbergia cavernae DSM 12333]|uniref:Uncharacterized protein n=1 Tax=Beutenbergia cavernae (strain ATCC BAA-8 / DSM 12333 / CCUG 43141 / JCM 11478 / NBRC 16432 / NCIMB 13614 / HKI 0122) TaxID=471853 RepID=C5C2X3_BEUC1|nr:glucoamylase family protein [Beutenbergia cavernae]ACQ81817.1 conserved hypothetical protein [Beutenbergia cavernae DSM 12333]
MRHRWLTASGAALVAGAMAFAAPAVAAPAAPEPQGGGGGGGGDDGLDRRDRRELMRWANDTWASFVAMTDEETGLPADNIEGDLDTGTRSGYTSPTNIGGYLWSTVVADELDIISHGEALRRMRQTLRTLNEMERHEPSGFFYNWYDEATGEKLTAFPNGETIYPFLSSVDNGWLTAALMVVRNEEPSLRRAADRLLDDQDYGWFYDPTFRGPDRPGLLFGGIFVDTPPDTQCANLGPAPGANGGEGSEEEVWLTCHHYDLLNSEPRIASYIGISRGEIPREHYFAGYRTFPATCDWDWAEQQPSGFDAEHLGQPVFEGSYTYRGMQIVPTWGGSMFEELMPDLFVPEADWAPNSWGVNHPLAVRAHIEHGLEETGYGYWGFSPASHPFGGYSEWGVDAIGMQNEGYPSDVERTNWDGGFGDCRPAANPDPDWGDGVVTPHAAFLALPYAPQETMSNLRGIEDELEAYGPGGFYDAVAVHSGQSAERYLSLDQGMIMGALGNVLGDGVLHDAFTRGDVREHIRPLLALETFSAGEG